MKILSFMVCEYATVTKDGTAIIIGAGADRVNLKEFPADVAFCFFCRIGKKLGSKAASGSAKITATEPDGTTGVIAALTFAIAERDNSVKLAHMVKTTVTEEKTVHFELSIDGHAEQAEMCTLTFSKNPQT